MQCDHQKSDPDRDRQSYRSGPGPHQPVHIDPADGGAGVRFCREAL
nr:MAG TPA: hypothetical protein [Bacteriophage sp.]